MKNVLSTTGWTSLVAVALSAAAVASEQDISLLETASWESFAGVRETASFAWSGEDETLFHSAGIARQIAQSEEGVNVEIVTALPAPEPPALVLAGMAFGGVLCGRSMLVRRRK